MLQRLRPQPPAQVLERQPQPGSAWGRARAGNAAAKGFASNAAKPKRSKAFGRQLWWLKDREEQKHFEVV